MTVEEIMEFRRAKPFKPFVLKLKDGREFVIRQPEAIGRDEKFTRVSFAAEDESIETVRIEAIAEVKSARIRRERRQKGRG